MYFGGSFVKNEHYLLGNTVPPADHRVHNPEFRFLPSGDQCFQHSAGNRNENVIGIVGLIFLNATFQLMSRE